MRLTALIMGWCFTLAALAADDGVWVDAGGCRLKAYGPNAARDTFAWDGACISGVAEGQGTLYRISADSRNISRSTYRSGDRVPRAALTVFAKYPDRFFRMACDARCDSIGPVMVTMAEVPDWAKGFLLGAAPPSIDHGAAARAEQARYAAEQEARDREEAREGIERRRRENEEDERRARREAEEEREARSRQWMDTAQTLMQGAAAMKRQQDEQNARRQAERARIEADNARYRQAQAEDSRRWAEQNQRMQQAAIERQRVEQERQRVEEARREEVRRRPREQRVNLPRYTGCIRLEWGKNIPQNNDQWYTLHNTCANDLHVHWCDRPGCQRPSAMALIRGGGNTRSWLLKKNGVAVTVVAACQLENGGKTVNLDRDDNQCWSMVTMN